MSRFRTESDALGEVEVPADAYYGAQTKRAVDNFPVSGQRFPRAFIRALGLIKQSAAEVNRELGLLPAEIAEAIQKAAQEVTTGARDHDFVVDVFQTGSGTSTNMNANEVIANRAIEILGGQIGSKHPVHPNDHVNLCQSSNDVIPTAIHVAAAELIHNDLIPAVRETQGALRAKAEAFAGIVKTGRTHLQDAVPVTLGQEFGGYASMMSHAAVRLKDALRDLCELAIGGTAVGTGVNTHVAFGPRVAKRLAEKTGLPFRQAPDLFEAISNRDASVYASGAMKTLACSLMKIGNDLRLLSSGPRCGLAEIILPSLQPGSSIMPGKINPVIPEVVNQVAAQVIGNDAAVTVGGQAGQLELNMMKPLIARNLLESATLLTNVLHLLCDKCLEGLKANERQIKKQVEGNLMLATALNPLIGYDRASAISKRAYREDKTVREVALEEGVASPEELENILDPAKMIGPNL